LPDIPMMCLDTNPIMSLYVHCVPVLTNTFNSYV